jgi:hypothetical protein
MRRVGDGVAHAAELGAEHEAAAVARAERNLGVAVVGSPPTAAPRFRRAAPRRRAAEEQHAIAALDEGDDEGDQAAAAPSSLVSGSSPARPARAPAAARQRTVSAAWRHRRAHGRAEFHQRLVRIARRRRVEQLRRRVTQSPAYGLPRDVLIAREPPRHHARDVAIEHRHLLAESDARHRGGRYSRRLPAGAQLLCRGRDRSSVLHHSPCGAVEESQTPVVAEPGPARQRVLERRLGEGATDGKRIRKGSK